MARTVACPPEARPPADERERPELTVEKRAGVHLKWRMGYRAEKDFAVLHRLDHKVWDAWLHPLHLEGHRVIRGAAGAADGERRQLRDVARRGLPGHG